MVGLILILLLNIQDTVTATTYKLTRAENGPYGNNMASGYKVSYKHPGNNRVIAVSPDLLDKYPYHTDVIVSGTGKYDGKYKVEDLMNARWHKRIDILLNWKTKHNKFYNVIITKYGKHRTHRSNNSNRHITSRNDSLAKHGNIKIKKSSKYKRRQSANRTIHKADGVRKIRSSSRYLKGRRQIGRANV